MAPLLAFDRSRSRWTTLRPLDRVLGSSSLALDGARLALRRNASGQLNLPQARTPPATRTMVAASDEWPPRRRRTLSPAPAWQLSLASASVRGGWWIDEDASYRRRIRLA